MTEFESRGYVIVKNFIPVKKWLELAYTLEPTGNMNDSQVGAGNPSFYGKMNELQELCHGIMESETNLSLFKTSNYFRIYKKGAYLKPHTDRAACEISVTLNLGGDDWKIGIFDYDSNPKEYLLNQGDALIYHGCDLVHWRPGLFKGKELVQIFLHYVNQNGPNAWAKDDINK